MPSVTSRAADGIFQALGDPTRRELIEALSLGPRSVSSLAAKIKVTLTAVGQHIQVLEQTGLIRTEKVGRVRTCRIEPAGFSPLERWISEHQKAWESRLDRLGELLEEDDEA